MASPQLEEGYLKIAFSLHTAIMQTDFTGYERRIIDAVMAVTYGRNKTKAALSLEDIWYLIGAPKNLRKYRLAQALDKLISDSVVYRQEMANGEYILGLVKDYDKWFAQNVHDNTTNTVISNTNTTSIDAHKMSAAERLLVYTQAKSSFKYTLQAYRIERSRAGKLIADATRLTREPKDALFALKDYIDELTADDWFRANVKFPMGYALSRFESWYKQIPAKTREVKESEQLTGKRYRYNTRKKKWEVSNDELIT